MSLLYNKKELAKDLNALHQYKLDVFTNACVEFISDKNGIEEWKAAEGVVFEHRPTPSVFRYHDEKLLSFKRKQKLKDSETIEVSYKVEYHDPRVKDYLEGE